MGARSSKLLRSWWQLLAVAEECEEREMPPKAGFIKPTRWLIGEIFPIKLLEGQRPAMVIERAFDLNFGFPNLVIV